MKCKHCDGVGFFENGASQFRCVYCDGSGEVPMTNEEWLKQANTEQLAEFLLNAIQKCKRCASGIGVADDDDSCPLGGCWDVKDIVEWLKQPHREE